MVYRAHNYGTTARMLIDLAEYSAFDLTEISTASAGNPKYARARYFRNTDNCIADYMKSRIGPRTSRRYGVDAANR